MSVQPNNESAMVCEADLVRQLIAMLRTDGYRVRAEVSNMGQSADLVATRGRWVTVVEAKLRHWRQALQQCRAHEQVADYICVVIASESVSDDLREEADELGYGVIHYDMGTEQFRWVLRPRRNRNFWAPQRRLWARHVKETAYVH